MPKVDTVESENESARSAPRSKRKSVADSPSKDRNTSMEVDEIPGLEAAEVPDDSEAQSGDGTDEEEYEIEAILDARKGAFPDGRTGYFVKWKGYGEEENSWVDEKDAVNAADLIEDYWRKTKKERQSGRKSLDLKPKSRRKSATTARQITDVEPGQTKKRGRPPKAGKQVVDDEVPSDEGETAPKKSRKSNGAKAAPPADQDKEATPPVGDMSKYMQIPTWENMIQSVDTVERSGKDLIVFFTLKKNSEHVQATSKVCAEKFPKKMLEFYESNLRWKIEDENSET